MEKFKGKTNRKKKTNKRERGRYKEVEKREAKSPNPKAVIKRGREKEGKENIGCPDGRRGGAAVVSALQSGCHKQEQISKQKGSERRGSC